MFSKITSKNQVTIPKEIRENLKVSASDLLDWRIENNLVRVTRAEAPFMKWRGFFKVAPGDIKEDIRKARKIRAERYR